MRIFRRATLLLSALSLIAGCAGVCRKDEKVTKVIDRQGSVLRKIIELRENEDFKKRLESDPVLVEQEAVLMAGVASVLKSEEAIVELGCKSKKCGGSRAKQ